MENSHHQNFIKRFYINMYSIQHLNQSIVVDYTQPQVGIETWILVWESCALYNRHQPRPPAAWFIQYVLCFIQWKKRCADTKDSHEKFVSMHTNPIGCISWLYDKLLWCYIGYKHLYFVHAHTHTTQSHPQLVKYGSLSVALSFKLRHSSTQPAHA